MDQQQINQRKFEQLSEAVVKLTIIQELQTKQLASLEKQAEDNTKYKARVGGIVIATVMIVSAAWAALLGIFQFTKG